MYYSAAVVGLNTSAFLEAAVVGKPVHSVLDETISKHNQEGTIHFHYLMDVNGGLLRVARTLDEHVQLLADSLASEGGGDVKAQRFVEGFIRPFGASVPATAKFADAIECIDLIRPLVLTDSQNARKAKRETAFVAVRALYVVEGYFQHNLWLYGSAVAFVFHRVLQKIAGKFADFRVGEPGIRLAHIEQTIAFAHGEGIVGEHAVPLAVAIFHGRDNDIERGKRLFQLEPEAAAASGCIQRVGSFSYDPFVACRERGTKRMFERLARFAHLFGRELEIFRLRRGKQLFQPATAFSERLIQQEFAVLIEKIEEHELDGNFLDQRCARVFAAQPLLQLREGQRLRVMPGQYLAVYDELARHRCERIA